ncbi:hypothetical protein ACG7TL_008049 [Trametes sanguinea]
MWLLTADRAQLLSFGEPPKEYAILSHVWRKNEQSFQQVHNIARRRAHTGENPRDLVSDKIRKCCMWAEAHGFKLLWIDTCCINKASSTELTEAINSMFAWYARATELIAPINVIFLSQSWTPVVSKHTVAKLLQKITGIDAGVLRGHRRLQDVSVARRMSWAARRQTTRLEDRAYCLMGIFDVKMLTIYGEGAEAFIRLQEEIIKRTADLSILAWGPQRDLFEVAIGYRTGIYPTPDDDMDLRQSCLLAQGPEEFAGARDVKPFPLDSFAKTFNLTMKRPQLLVSSHGVHIHLPIIIEYQNLSKPTIERRHIFPDPCPHIGDFPKGHWLCCTIWEPWRHKQCCVSAGRPIRESEVGWTPILQWDEISIAYRLSHILVRFPPRPSRPSRKAFMAPCKFIITSWTFSGLERANYRLLFPMSLPTFYEMTPGKQLCFVFTKVVHATNPHHYSAFAVHIAADSWRDDGARGNAYFAAGGENEPQRQAAIWCLVNFCPPARYYRAHNRAMEVADWIATEWNKRRPAAVGAWQ